MNKPLDQLTQAELIALLVERDQRIEKLEGILAKFQKMLFGQKRERFESPDQLSLPFEIPTEVQQSLQEELTQKVEYVRRKSGAAHPGRTKLPEHLPVEEIELYPQGNLEEMTCIGKEITEELDYKPAQFIIRRYIRYKYAVSQAQEGQSSITIAALPSRLIDKSIVGTGLLACILTDKYVDHLPLYRQLQRFKRENIPIAASTLDGWVRQGLERLEILYGWLVKDACGKGYLQADETSIKVLDSTKKKDTHLGYYWVYHNPVDGTVLFDYQKGRNQEAPQKILEGFKGYLQTDGYIGYEPYAALPGVTHLCCWAHARRKFFEARENDKARAELALVFIGKLYEVEAHCREKKLAPQDRKAYRLDKALPILDAFSKWLTENYAQTLPKSDIAKAMAYTMRLWKELSNYLLDGVLEIDNNPVENRIRPVALGRKNYLFAGSHDAAQRSAMIYSFFAMCKIEEVNPQHWLKYVFDHIMDTNIQKIHELLPKHYKLSLAKNHTT